MLENIKELFEKVQYKKVYELSKELKNILKENNAIVLFGQSDDIVSASGLFSDEIYVYNDTMFLIDKEGFIPDNIDDIDNDEDLENYLKRKKNSIAVDIKLFSSGQTININTKYENSISFDIMEDEEIYGNGLILIF